MSGGTLRFAANMGLAHMHCATCKEERLHHKMSCVSCKTHYDSGRRYKAGNWGEFQVNKGSLKRQREFQMLKALRETA